MSEKENSYYAEDNPCEGCSSCCEHVALEIDTPTTVSDFNNILWFVLHKDVFVYITRDNTWHLQFNSQCEKLQNKRCEFYDRRPLICRDYEVDSCVNRDGEECEKHIFKTETDYINYLQTKRPAILKRMRAKQGAFCSV